jgi:hypothetical protein
VSVTLGSLREEHRLRVFENRLLRGIFGLKRAEIIGWRKLHIEKPHNFHFSRNIIRMLKSTRMGLPGHVQRMDRRGMHTGFGEKARSKETTKKT